MRGLPFLATLPIVWSRLVLVSLLVATACVAEPDFEGRPCPCPVGWTCVQDVCSASPMSRDAGLDGGDDVDAGSEDAGLVDATVRDAGPRDAGFADAGDPIVVRCMDPVGFPTVGWEARYFELGAANTFGECFGVVDLPGDVLTRDFGVAAPVGTDRVDFTARYSATRTFEAGVHTMTLAHDDGIRVFIDGALVFEDWQHGFVANREIETGFLTPGAHQILVEHYDDEGAAQIGVSWRRGCVDPPPLESRWHVTYFALDAVNQIDPQVCLGHEFIDSPALEASYGPSAPAAVVAAGLTDRFALVAETRRDFNGDTRFYLTHDDGLRMLIDGTPIYDQFIGGPVRSQVLTRAISGPHDLRVEKSDVSNDAEHSIRWLTTCADRPSPQTAGWFVAYHRAVAVQATWELDRTYCIGSEILGTTTVDWTTVPNVPSAAGYQEMWGADYYGTRTFASTQTVMVSHDDGLRIFTGNNPVYENWRAPNVVQNVPVAFGAGTHTLHLEYFEWQGGEQLRFAY